MYSITVDYRAFPARITNLCRDRGRRSTNSSLLCQSLSGSIELRISEKSKLAVSIYPKFSYDAVGGGGLGKAIQQKEGILYVDFDPRQLEIPPLDYRTSKVLGIPIPPPLKIQIKTQSLQGTLDMESGHVELDFAASFLFSIGSLYTPPALSIQTTLTTGTSTGRLFTAHGSPLADTKATLVGVSQVPKTEDPFLNAFLMLPSEALAELSVNLILL